MKFYSQVFPNKLKGLVVHDADSLSVSILVLVRIGSRFENEQNSGIAHFVEHTIFKGTKKRPKTKQIAMEIEQLGANMNAFTSYDYTGYYIKVPKEKFEAAIEVLSDMFQNSLFEQVEIDKERGVIIEEKNMYDDQPMDKVSDVFNSVLFKDHALGREIVGSFESLNSIQRHDFMDFLGKYYGAENSLVVVAGAVKQDKAFESINRYFGNMEQKEYSVPDKYMPGKMSSKTVNLYRPISQSHIILGGFALPRPSKDRYIAKVGNAVLAKGFGSRLFQVIRDELGLAYYVYSNIMEFQETGAFNIGIGVENNKIQKAVDAVLKQLRAIASGDFEDVELDRAKNYLIGNLTTGLEATDDLALWYGLQSLLDNRVLSVEQVKQKIFEVSKEDIVRVWSGLVSLDNLLLASVSPHKKLDVELNL